MRRLVTAAELALLLGLSQSSVRRKAYAGELPSIKCGSSKKAALRFDIEEVFCCLKGGRKLQHSSDMAK